MNQGAIMQTSEQLSSASKWMLWLGSGLTALVVLFLLFDAVTKVIQVKPVMEACQKMNISPPMAVGIGILLLVCTALYVTPKTAILGAILLTGYLGGAAATHVIARSGAFPTAFAISFGVLAWAGLVLREPRLVRWILLRE
jgi:DoxX-like protein